jgi:hypothetical protein
VGTFWELGFKPWMLTNLFTGVKNSALRVMDRELQLIHILKET